MDFLIVRAEISLARETFESYLDDGFIVAANNKEINGTLTASTSSITRGVTCPQITAGERISRNSCVMDKCVRDRSDRARAHVDHRRDHTRFQLSPRALLNIKSRLFARKMVTVLGYDYRAV